ncbi:MAG: VIT1/CCC1 transporter family protein [Candidatus Omnitrophota bacterium]
MTIDPQTKSMLLQFQKNEITEHHIYLKLSRIIKGEKNRALLKKIAADERDHYFIFKKYTNEDVRPDHARIVWYYLISRIFGLSFGLKLMERGEGNAQKQYGRVTNPIVEVEKILTDEDAHENALLNLLDEEMLQYTGSMVLGLNDALVELTGALAGFTLALRNTKLIALVGLVTGISAALSMASSEYLSTKSEETNKNPLKASVYTGVAYLATVFILITPYLIGTNYFACLGAALMAAVVIIFCFNYYISVAKDRPFKKHFLEMVGLSLGVAVISFLIGFLLRKILPVEV